MTMTLIQRERNHEGFLIMDEPAPITTQIDGREWSLEVPQQPIRARMCGFGDKVGIRKVDLVHPLTLCRTEDRLLLLLVCG